MLCCNGRLASVASVSSQLATKQAVLPIVRMVRRDGQAANSTESRAHCCRASPRCPSRAQAMFAIAPRRVTAFAGRLEFEADLVYFPASHGLGWVGPEAFRSCA